MNFEINLHGRLPNCLCRICKLLCDDFQGMIFIHDSVIESHGKLRSSNIYIDSRWMCKIGDLPMPNFCDGEKMCDDEKNSESFSKLLLICDWRIVTHNYVLAYVNQRDVPLILWQII